MAGYGAGTLTLTPEGKNGENGENGESRRRCAPDLDLMMGALGLRGVVLQAPEGGGPARVNRGIHATSDSTVFGSQAVLGVATDVLERDVNDAF